VSRADDQQSRLLHWEQRTEWPMAALAVLFLAVYATEVLATGLPSGWHSALVVLDYTIWAIFVAEFLVRVTLATRRGWYLLHHVPDLAMLGLPFLRTLRVLRLVPLLRALNRWVADSLRGKVVVYGSTTAVLLVFTGSLAALDAERNAPGASITDFGRALWWGCATITTVGYGDVEPVTGQGRLVGVAVMVGGVMLVGAVTASFATWLIDRLRVEEEVDQATTQADLQAVHSQLQAVQAELADLKAMLRGGQPDDRSASASS
jgi:voltage-gated potassium channel